MGRAHPWRRRRADHSAHCRAATLATCLAGAILIFSISFRELVGSVLLRPPGMQTVSTFILREFDQESPATGMAMGVVAIAVSLLSISLARRLVPKKL